jgi:hypothetical protein
MKRSVATFAAVLALASLTAGCAGSGSGGAQSPGPAGAALAAAPQITPPSPDPRLGLSAGLMNAGEAIWNMRVISKTPPTQEFVGAPSSDLAFLGNYAIQGNFNGFQIWDISNPAAVSLVKSYVCPASQSDVSVYRNLLFVSGEGLEGRLDCGKQGVPTASSADRLLGIRIFDISDIRNPRYVANVQTCRGSHTHSLLVDPNDNQNVYVYVSGSSQVRPATELAGCSGRPPSEDPQSALFRIEVIRVPLANPAAAAIVSSPRIFADLVAPPEHGPSRADLAELEEARRQGKFIVKVQGEDYVLPDEMIAQLLMQVAQRAGRSTPSAADSASLRQALPQIIAQMVGPEPDSAAGPQPGPTQCHDITLYPAIGYAGGACEGYGMLIDIKDPVNPRRLAAASDSNFSYWHSATFNNDGTKLLFTDEWGGGGGPKCRADDPKEWGANAIFRVEGNQLRFQSYYKLPVAQTPQENCVAHNGSMIPIPGRDVMVQSWYQGGISVFDWSDPTRPTEIAFFDRGPVDASSMQLGGTWSVYWYNGLIVSSEILRGLDILELTPSPALTQNEIDAAKTVRFDYYNTQGQQRFVWPASFALARAYVDQLQRSGGLSAQRVQAVMGALQAAERQTGAARQGALRALGTELDGDAGGSRDAGRVRMLRGVVGELANGG